LVGAKELISRAGRREAGEALVVAKGVRSTMVSNAQSSCCLVEKRRKSVGSSRSSSVSGEEGS
jgi:hypothetical protein